jgi:hypothetical protein
MRLIVECLECFTQYEVNTPIDPFNLPCCPFCGGQSSKTIGEP